MSSSIVLPEVEEDIGSGSGYGGWIVTVFNNNHNTYDEVIMILQVATGCGADEAYMEAWEIDHMGCSVVHQGGEAECKDVAKIIATIGIKVEATES